MAKPEMAGDDPLRRQARFEFGMRAVMVAVLAVAVLAVVIVKLQQDARFEAALEELGALDFNHSVGQNKLRLEAHKATLSEHDVERLLASIEVLRSPHDLGLSPGLEIEQLDLTASEISPPALERLREALPNTKIER